MLGAHDKERMRYSVATPLLLDHDDGLCRPLNRHKNDTNLP